MSRRGSQPFNWDRIDCPKFVDFEKVDSPQASQSLESYFDTHKESPPLKLRRKLASLTSAADTGRMSRRGSQPFNWDRIDCPKFVDFEKVGLTTSQSITRIVFRLAQGQPAIET
ncbi:hypothetical protein MRX96_048593 [Rhipicephalus microplus]